MAQAEGSDTLNVEEGLEYSDIVEEDYEPNSDVFIEPSPPMPAVEKKALDAKRWKALTKDLRFDDFKQPKERKKQQQLPDFSFLSGIGATVKIIFILLVLGVLITLVLRWVISYRSNPKAVLEQLSFEIDAQSVQLPISELDQLIAAAVADQSYALAVKLYYLKSLSLLNLKHHIMWERHKTNDHYLRECKQKPFFQIFRKLTRLYENYWYGTDELESAKFNEIQTLYIDFYQKIH